MKKMWINVLLAVFAVVLLVVGYMASKNDNPVRELPYFKPVEKGAEVRKDSLGRHLVSDFSLTDQTGKTITRADFSNSITVVDFFFARCQGICPRMTSQMQRVYETFRGNPEVKLLSHTVNPENDSVEVLKAYAERYHADADQWHFVTGDKPQLYNLARKSYLISDTEGNGGKEDFVHSQNFALVDKQGHVRGIYDGTDSTDVDRLMLEMRMLLKEKK